MWAFPLLALDRFSNLVWAFPLLVLDRFSNLVSAFPLLKVVVAGVVEVLGRRYWNLKSSGSKGSDVLVNRGSEAVISGTGGGAEFSEMSAAGMLSSVTSFKMRIGEDWAAGDDGPVPQPLLLGVVTARSEVESAISSDFHKGAETCIPVIGKPSAGFREVPDHSSPCACICS